MKAFLKEYGHRIFTFMVGLAFICLVLSFVCFLAIRTYRIFVPDNIYVNPEYKDTLTGALVYETQAEDAPEEGSAEFFEDYIYNLVKLDMPDFEDPSQINDEYIISFGLWQAIKLNNTGVYAFDSKNNFRVPKDDVENFALYCFDFPRKIDHHTVDVCGEFKYNWLNKTYKVRSTGVQNYLVPDVVDVEKDENDNYTLTVDCYNGSLISADDPTNDPANFYKRVEIVLQDLGVYDFNAAGHHRYLIQSMTEVEDDETPTVGEDVTLD
ncbi:MAG: hypothetical protein IJ408_00225 [Clostridia bacterium]|nr:hypothetical protein [Clostridia bacterium]